MIFLSISIYLPNVVIYFILKSNTCENRPTQRPGGLYNYIHSKISLMLILLKICLDKENVLFSPAFIQRISITNCYAWLHFEREHWSQKRNCINSHFAKRKKEKAEGNVSQSTLYYTTMCTSYSNQILYYNIKQLFSSSNFTQ